MQKRKETKEIYYINGNSLVRRKQKYCQFNFTGKRKFDMDLKNIYDDKIQPFNIGIFSFCFCIVFFIRFVSVFKDQYLNIYI